MAYRRRKAIAVLALTLELCDDEYETKRGETRRWMKRRERRGCFENIISELSLEDAAGFKEMMRMTYDDFLYVLRQIEADITPQEIRGGHGVVSSKARLALTLRFLATGEAYRSLSFQFRISRAAVSYIITNVCKAITRRLGRLYLKVPATSEEWVAISEKFQEKWNYPNCLGAVDGKHVLIQPPSGSGSVYYNYKHSHSIVLMVVAGPDYECLYAEIGTNGRVSDGGVWKKSTFCRKLNDNELYLPPPRCLPFGKEEVPFVFVGDDAFALRPNFMKPYPQAGLTQDKRIYNYRHSRARRISENLFGILVNRWRLFTSTIFLPSETVEQLVLATISLHNFLRKSSSWGIYCPVGLNDHEDQSGNFVEGYWRRVSRESMLPSHVSSSGHNPCYRAKTIRDTVKDYFCHDGAVGWQWSSC